MTDAATVLAELAKLRAAIEELTQSVKAISSSSEQGVKVGSEWIDWNYDSAQKLRKGDRVTFSPHGLRVLRGIGWLHDEVEDGTVFRVTGVDWEAEDHQPILFEAVSGEYASCWPNFNTTGIQFLMVGGGVL